jgi:serine/threonine protein kinase
MASTISDRDTFLQYLQESELLSHEQLRHVMERSVGAVTAGDIARILVRRGWLTRFQARMLLHGRTGGFFLGPYRILDLVGKGGMGRVYKALHQTMNRTVALKVLSPNLVKTDKARRLFNNEVQTAARLNHPNIVHAYDANAVDGRHYLAMEFIDGTTLSKLVHLRGPLPVGLACEVVRQAALGLQHAHEQGLVHRDIKPANLMVAVVRGNDQGDDTEETERRVQVKILDLGLAKLHRRRKSAAADTALGKHPITGTPDFMSPEQARNRDMVDIRADLYSLGCTFYFLLTGHVPFPGGTMLDKLIRHHSELPTSPDKLRPGIPPDVIAIVVKLMRKDPFDRFQTPQELVDALAPYASVPTAYRPRTGEPLAALPPAEPVVPIARPADKAPPPIPDDNTLPANAATEISAEQEALAAWVQVCLAERRRQRRRTLWFAGAAITLAAAATSAALLWQYLL